jgi:hypothetical protein
MKRPASLCGLLFCLLGCVQLACSQYKLTKSEDRSHVFSKTTETAADYKCKQAGDEDRPRGGNFVLAGEGKFKAIYGTVLSKDESGTWEPMGDVIVELYSYSGGANREDVSKAIRGQKRLTACLTGGDGKFSLSGLKPGRYLFRAGSRMSDKYDEVHAILTLDPGGPLSELKILL